MWVGAVRVSYKGGGIDLLAVGAKAEPIAHRVANAHHLA